MNFAAKHVCKSEVGIVQPHSLVSTEIMYTGEVMHRPRSDSAVHIDVENKYHIRMEK